MANDKKPKKAKPAIVHGATAASRGTGLAAKQAETPVKTPLVPAKKKR